MFRILGESSFSFCLYRSICRPLSVNKFLVAQIQKRMKERLSHLNLLMDCWLFCCVWTRNGNICWYVLWVVIMLLLPINAPSLRFFFSCLVSFFLLSLQLLLSYMRCISIALHLQLSFLHVKIGVWFVLWFDAAVRLDRSPCGLALWAASMEATWNDDEL